MKTPREYYRAIATLTGCIIGAGIFGIPYVAVKAGFWTGMFVLVIVAIMQLTLALLLGEIALRTKACHQATGYAEKYLGRPGKFFMLVAMMMGIYGGLVAYTIGVGESLTAVFGGSTWVWSAIFYAIMAWLVFGGLKVLEDTELAMESVKFALLAGILGLLFLSPHFRWGNLTGFSFENVLLPYGVLLFAMLGTPVIPEAHAMMQKCRKWTKRAIIIGTMIPAVVYALFTIGIVGISGEKTTEVATVGAAEMVNGGSIVFHLFAVLAMASSFVALAFALKDTFRLDLKRTNVEAWMLTLSVPLVLLWLGVSSFTATLELAGAFAGGIAGICIVLMHRRARGKSERKPEYRILPGWFGYAAIILLLAVGMAYQLSFVL